MWRARLRPIVHGVRSVLGTNGLSARLSAIEDRLRDAGTAAEVATRANETAPPTKMEAVNEGERATLNYTKLTGDPPPPSNPSTFGAGSRLCRQADLCTDGFRYWIAQMGLRPQMHRKQWEWYFAADVLWRLGMLAEGRRGLGFGVGQEPLTALFAARGCHIVATDMDPDEARNAGWATSDQHADSLAALDKTGICPPELLRERVRFRVVDMNDIPADLENFDFCWSSCSLEHLGSLRHGADFVVNAMRCLAPGGVAVHTTEFNMDSAETTFESKELSLYRRQDIETLIGRLEAAGHRVEPMDWAEGQGFADGYVDLPPFDSPLHLRLRLWQYRSTSIGLIIHARDGRAMPEVETGR